MLSSSRPIDDLCAIYEWTLGLILIDIFSIALFFSELVERIFKRGEIQNSFYPNKNWKVWYMDDLSTSS